MAYHHHNNYGYNNRGGGGGGGGFRNHFNNHHNSFNNHPRINEMQVPQSKHTIFIRGLHGDITTEEIKEYIGEKVGKVSFDFVKVAQDKSKIFVAVRFEKREEAKEFMETYADREFMGCRCDLSWFRDIRRYCAYQRAKQVRSNSQRRRRRSDSEESKHSSPRRSASPPIRRRSRSRSRSRSQTRSRSGSVSRSPTRSRSPVAKKERASRNRTRSRSSRNSRSRSNTRSRSRSSNRSRSASSRRSDNRYEESSDAESGDEKHARTKDNGARQQQQKRRRESEASARGGDRDEEKVAKKKVKGELPQIPLPPKNIKKASKTSSPAPPTPKAKPAAFIPPPTDMELESPPQHVSTNPYQNYQQQGYQNYQSFPNKKEQSPAATISYSVPMEEEATPKMIVRDPYNGAPIQHQQPSSTTMGTPQGSNHQTPPVTLPTTPQPAFVPRQVGKIEIVMPVSLPAPVVVAQAAAAATAAASVPSISAINGSGSSSSNMMLDIAQFPTTNKLFGHLKAFQSALLSTVKYEPPVKKEESAGELSGLRLSTLATEEDSEEQKSLERESKLSKLSDEQMMRFHIKKKQLEAAFRNDCETYAVVTRALLAKDEALQFGLKMSLLENMEDLYKKMMQRIDDQLDQLMVMA